MKKAGSLLLVFILIAATGAVGYEQPMLNMKAPTGLGEKQLDFTIMHRFFGNVAAGQSPVGRGANVAFRLRYAPPVRGVEVEAEYTAVGNEISIGGSYARSIPGVPATGQLFAQFYTLSHQNRRVSGGYGSLALQSDPIFRRGHLKATVGYDSYFRRVNTGAGLVIDVIPEVSLVGEYFAPLNGGVDTWSGDAGAYAVGVSVNTAGHHFTVLATNRFHIGEHRQTDEGTFGELYFGFNLQRLFWL